MFGKGKSSTSLVVELTSRLSATTAALTKSTALTIELRDELAECTKVIRRQTAEIQDLRAINRALR